MIQAMPERKRFFSLRPSLIQCPVGGSVGGCGARAVSRKTPIYFMYSVLYRVCINIIIIITIIIISSSIMYYHNGTSMCPLSSPPAIEWRCECVQLIKTRQD